MCNLAVVVAVYIPFVVVVGCAMSVHPQKSGVAVSPG